MKKSISVICCYNNKETYQNALVASIKLQNIAIELIGLNNTKDQYPSAASALNHGATLAQAEVLVFMHQDVVIDDPMFFSKLLDYYLRYPKSLMGIAGVGINGTIYTNITQGQEKLRAGTPFKSLTEAQSLDELMICISSDVFKQTKFDELTCNHWHLYVVDLGYSLQRKGIKCYIVPLKLHHLSSGKLSKEYAFSLYKVINKHRKTLKRIETTCTSTKTGWMRSTQYILGLIWDHEIKK